MIQKFESSPSTYRREARIGINYDSKIRVK